MPPLSKGGGLTARHKLLPCCVLIAAYPPFLCYKLFCRQDGGIATPLLAPHQPFQNRTIPRKAPSPLPLNERFASFASALSHSLFVGERACPSRCTECCHSHNHCKSTNIPRPAPSPLPPLSKVRCCRPKKFGRLPEGLFPLSTIITLLPSDV